VVRLCVTVLGIDVLEKATERHADLRGTGAAWLKVARSQSWRSLAEIRRTWRDTDCVEGETIFNVKGNKYRLVALVNYEAQTIIITRLMTHAEYSKR
jgi:mRNA interferase HigB